MRSFGYYSIEECDAATYTLPDPLRTFAGEKIASAAQWSCLQRREILELLKKYEYGEILPRPDKLEFSLISPPQKALGGRAVRKEVKITAAMADGREHSFIVLSIPVLCPPLPG